MRNYVDFLKLKVQTCNIEGTNFDIMSLTSEQKDKLKLCDSYDSMLGFAADNGLADGENRIINHEYMASRLELLWSDKEYELDSDPCLRYRIGEMVCSISELDDVLEEMLEAKEEKERKELEQQTIESGNINGDESIPDIDIDRLNDGVTTGQLENDAEAYAIASNM